MSREANKEKLDDIFYKFYLRIKHREMSLDQSFEIALPGIQSLIDKSVKEARIDVLEGLQEDIELGWGGKLESRIIPDMLAELKGDKEEV